MTHSSLSIANAFLDLAAADGKSVTPMKLQKLVYYAHGWYAGYKGEPLIDEAVEAWQYGPVIPSIYHEFKRYGAGTITSKATEVDWKELELREVPVPDDPALRKFLTNVWGNLVGFNFLNSHMQSMGHGILHGESATGCAERTYHSTVLPPTSRLRLRSRSKLPQRRLEIERREPAYSARQWN